MNTCWRCWLLFLHCPFVWLWLCDPATGWVTPCLCPARLGSGKLMTPSRDIANSDHRCIDGWKCAGSSRIFRSADKYREWGCSACTVDLYIPLLRDHRSEGLGMWSFAVGCRNLQMEHRDGNKGDAHLDEGVQAEKCTWVLPLIPAVFFYWTRCSNI